MSRIKRARPGLIRERVLPNGTRVCVWRVAGPEYVLLATTPDPDTEYGVSEIVRERYGTHRKRALRELHRITASLAAAPF